jgi:hypothetical protein
LEVIRGPGKTSDRAVRNPRTRKFQFVEFVHTGTDKTQIRSSLPRIMGEIFLRERSADEFAAA